MAEVLYILLVGIISVNADYMLVMEFDRLGMFFIKKKPPTSIMKTIFMKSVSMVIEEGFSMG